MTEPLTDEQLKEIEGRCKAATPFCDRCRDKGTISVKHGMTYITDDDEERALAWHEEDCPKCGNFPKNANRWLRALIDSLKVARAYNAAIVDSRQQVLDECETLRRESDALREALRPFADYGSGFNDDWPDTCPISVDPDAPVDARPNIGDLRRAAAALSGQAEQPAGNGEGE